MSMWLLLLILGIRMTGADQIIESINNTTTPQPLTNLLRSHVQAPLSRRSLKTYGPNVFLEEGEGSTGPLFDTTVTMLHKTSVNITSPNYPGLYPVNSSIQWIFRTDGDTRIMIELLDFSTETNFDFLYIREHENLVMTLTGLLTFPLPYVSRSNEVTLDFQSDSSNGMRGFSLRITPTRDFPHIPLSQCGFESEASERNQTLGSPNWPLTYFKDSNCTWTITSPDNTHLRLYMEQFDTEECCDTLSGYYENTTRKVFRISGKYRQTQTYDVPTSFLTLKFKTDRSDERHGFLLKYHFIHDTVDDMLLPVAGNVPGLNLAYVPYRILYPEYNLNLTGKRFMRQVSFTNSPTEWSYSFPGTDAMYPPNTDTLFILRAFVDDRYRITFNTFSMEDGHDFIHIFDGGLDYPQQVYSITGESLPTRSTV